MKEKIGLRLSEFELRSARTGPMAYYPWLLQAPSRMVPFCALYIRWNFGEIVTTEAKEYSERERHTPYVFYIELAAKEWVLTIYCNSTPFQQNHYHPPESNFDESNVTFIRQVLFALGRIRWFRPDHPYQPSSNQSIRLSVIHSEEANVIERSIVQ